MIRTLLVLLAVAFITAVAIAATGDAGSASVTWLGWRIDTTASAALVTVVFGALVATLIWQLLLWFLAAPARAARARAETRRREGAESLARGFVAVAAGAGTDARRLAQKAADYIDDQPALVRVLAASAAEAAGDEAAAMAAYNAMLGFPELRLAGHRGLMLQAQRRGDAGDAVRHAEAAYGLTKTARWAWRALLEAAQDEGLLDPSISADLLERSLSSFANGTMLSWAMGAVSTEALGPTTALGYALALRGAATAAGAALLQARILRCQTQLAEI